MTDLATDLRRLVTEGGDANRLVLDTDRGYVVVRGRAGSERVDLEVSAGRQLPDGPLTDAAHQALHDADFRRRSAAENYRKRNVGIEGLAHEVERLVELLESEREPARALHLGERDRTANPELVDAMRRLSQARDMRTRREVYMALLRAELLFVTETQVADGAPFTPRAVGELAKMIVAAAFTDFDALERYEPRGLPYTVRPGTELFPFLARERVASLLINPRGKVGGELYRNELLTISEGAARLAGRD